MLRHALRLNRRNIEGWRKRKMLEGERREHSGQRVWRNLLSRPRLMGMPSIGESLEWHWWCFGPLCSNNESDRISRRVGVHRQK